MTLMQTHVLCLDHPEPCIAQIITQCQLCLIVIIIIMRSSDDRETASRLQLPFYAITQLIFVYPQRTLT